MLENLLFELEVSRSQVDWQQGLIISQNDPSLKVIELSNKIASLEADLVEKKRIKTSWERKVKQLQDEIMVNKTCYSARVSYISVY